MARSGNPGPPGEQALASRLCWFAVAGLGGFLVDSGALTVLVHLDLDMRLARPISLTCAVIVTWLINRTRTFGDRTARLSLAEFLRYASASMLAAFLNLAVFAALVTFSVSFAERPVLAVAVATALSMSVNFWSYIRIVFTAKH